jgi:hypothetical protein
MTDPALPYRVPHAPEWVYRRLAGLPVEPVDATVTDEDLDLEYRIERSPRHSTDGYDELGWDA